MDTTCSAIVNATSIEIYLSHILDLTGIEYFDNLQILHCGTNGLTFLPVLPSTLKFLDCSYNQYLHTLTMLPAGLKTLYCLSGHLDSLPVLPDSLEKLDCSWNQLYVLPSLPSTVHWVDCSYNHLAAIPALPAILDSLNCTGNHFITSLPSLPDSLIYLSCIDNQIVNLPVLPQKLFNLQCGYNQLQFLPVLPSSLSILGCDGNMFSSLPQLPSALKEISCGHSNTLTSLPSLPDSLIKLWCLNAQLSSLPTLPLLLKDLNCFHNLLTSMPALPSSLNFLDCQWNQLTTMPQLPDSIIQFNCANNQITSLLNLPDRLFSFRCDYNQLTSLPALPDSLVFLECHNNMLDSIPALPNTLFSLQCYNNNITSLPALPSSLKYAECQDNLLTSIESLPDTMEELFIYNNPDLNCLPPINKLYKLYWYNTAITCLPNYVSADYVFPALNSIPVCDVINKQNCAINWNISGNVFSDVDNNCLINAGEYLNSNVKVNLFKNGSLHQQTFTNAIGQYSFKADTGSYVCAVDTAGIPFTVNCPGWGSYSCLVTAANTSIYSRDFSLACKSGYDIGISGIVSQSGVFRPAASVAIQVLALDINNMYNLHCASGISGSVVVVIDGSVSITGACPGALLPNIINDSLIYSISDFGTVNFQNDFCLKIKVDTSALLGEEVCFNATVTPLSGDVDTTNNIYHCCFTVVNSYDPNDKAVSPTSATDTSQYWFTYTVRFQNTGNAPAQHIYIVDTLDNNIDESSIQLLAYSHEPMVQVKGKAVRFNFANINLPDSVNDEPNSHGYVQYKVKRKGNLPVGTQIRNTAYIYFDFNAPVVTNTTVNTLTIPSVVSEVNPDKTIFTIFPNPVSSSSTLNVFYNSTSAKGI